MNAENDDLRPLTPQEMLFVEAYASPESQTYSKGTLSAKAAGLSQPHNAQWKLRQRPAVIAAIDKMHAIAAAGLGKVMSDLEHTRQLALDKGDLATATRCSELQGRRLGAFSDVLTLDPGKIIEYNQRNLELAREVAAIMEARLAQPAKLIIDVEVAPAVQAAPQSTIQSFSSECDPRN